MTFPANLRKEFDAEREEMEEQFRERLSQVKEEFAKELQDATQEMRQKHQKELGNLYIRAFLYQTNICCRQYYVEKLNNSKVYGHIAKIF